MKASPKRLNGGLTHGILTMLNTRGLNGARTTELMNAFPSIKGSSVLTYMRRKGLIVKSGLKPIDPWVISAAGLSLLSTLVPYTPKIYWSSVWNVKRGYNTMKSLGFGNLNDTQFGWEQPAYMGTKQFGNQFC